MSKIQDFLDGFSSGLQVRLNTETEKKDIYKAARAQTYTITDTNTSGWPLSTQETIGQLLRYIFPSEEGDISDAPTMSTPGLSSTPIMPPSGGFGGSINPDYINVNSILTGRDATDTTKEVYNKLKKNYRANYEITNINASKDFGGQKWFDNFMSSALSSLTIYNIKFSDIKTVDDFEEIFDDLNEKFKREFGNPRHYYISSRYFTPILVLYDAFIEAGPNYVQSTGSTPAAAPGPTEEQVVASQVVTPIPDPPLPPPNPPPGKLYNAIIFNVEKNNILVPTQNTFDLGELTIVKRDYTPPVPVSTNKPSTDIGEFSNMAPVDVPEKAPAGKTSPSKYDLKPTSYAVANKKDKAQIMLHYSAGWQMTDKCKQVVNFLMTRNHVEKNQDHFGLSYNYIIAIDGHIENMVDPKNTAFHGGGNSNYYCIGISLQCLGVTFHSSKNGLLSLEQADKQVDSYRLNSRHPDYKLGESHVELVDFNEKKKPYRNIRFSQEVSNDQLRSLSSLLKKLRQEFPDIPAWDGLTQEKFDILFPNSGVKTYEKDKPGIYSHCSLTGKVDILPTPKMIKFLKDVRF